LSLKLNRNTLVFFIFKKGAKSTHDPFWVVTALDALEKILSMHVCIHSSGELSFLPQQRGFALHGSEPELDELGLAVIADKTEGVDSPGETSQYAAYLSILKVILPAICVPVGTNGTTTGKK
jgi:hypothetical protein